MAWEKNKEKERKKVIQMNEHDDKHQFHYVLITDFLKNARGKNTIALTNLHTNSQSHISPCALFWKRDDSSQVVKEFTLLAPET